MSAAVATARRGAASRASGVRRERHHVSYPLLTAVLALVAIGVVMVYSASSVQSYLRTSDASRLGIQQAIWAALGLGAMFLASRTDFRLLRYLAIPLYIGTLALLVAVLIPGIGYEAFGSRRWIVILGIGFQPAELAKLAICIYLAHWLDRRG
ncbi:MAG TPA: FtsW/RodA/SpoVE family cell cycle protein, partial [Candidatus Limnocylindria bacterium]|nr:FtsW/RodA/SpoVE family cell cycle protein [Candidatus Limnocylindria bacterium]